MTDQRFEPHDGRHQNCPPCFAVKLSTIQIQRGGAGDRRKSEKERNRDMAEYPVLRNQGYQPAHVFGCAEVAAQAGSDFEIENHVIMSKDIRKEMLTKIADAKEIAEGKA